MQRISDFKSRKIFEDILSTVNTTSQCSHNFIRSNSIHEMTQPKAECSRSFKIYIMLNYDTFKLPDCTFFRFSGSNTY